MDFLEELNAELAEITEKAKKASQAEKLRRASNNMRLPAASRQAAKAEFLLIQTEAEKFLWSAKTSIALFSEQQCDGCGSVHRTFLQFMEHQVHNTKPTNQRWVRVSKPHPDLPRESLIQPLSTHICPDCCEDHGFGIFPNSPRLETSASITASPTYTQEDLNAEG